MIMSIIGPRETQDYRELTVRTVTSEDRPNPIPQNKENKRMYAAPKPLSFFFLSVGDGHLRAGRCDGFGAQR